MLAKRGIALLFMTVTPLALPALAAGCSSSSAKSPATNPEAGAPGGTASIAHFVLSGDTPPNYLDVPFPSDVYLSGGKIVDPIPGFDQVFKAGAQYVTHELAKMDGFSRITLSMFYIDPPAAPAADAGKAKAFSAIDPTSLPTSEPACLADASSVFLVDLAASSPAKARVGCRATYHDDTGEPTYSKTRPVLAVGPARGIVLAEAHQYAAVVTSRVKDTAGNHLVASSDFASVATGPRTGPVATLYGNAIDKANAALQSALATDGATIVSIAPYTTNDMTQQLFRLRASLDAQPAPALAWDAKTVAPMGAIKFAQKVNGALPAGFTDTLDDWLGVATKKLADGSDDPDSSLPVRAHDKIAAIGTSVFQANNYLNYSASGFGALDDGTFNVDASGNIQPAAGKPTAPIWVSFAVPTAPMPPGGYPVVIVQHGLNGSRAGEFMTLSNVFANQGWMVAAIDSVTFGARAAETYYQVDTTTDWVGGPGVTYNGPDGIADKVDPSTMKPSPTGSTNGSNDLFGSLLALGAFRDQVRQAEIDTTQLIKVLRSNPNLAPLQTGATAPKIDPTKIAYFGVSLGSLEGEVAAALEPGCKLWVFDVGGGGLITELASHGPIVGTLLSLAGAVNFGFLNDQFDESHPMMAQIQQVADPADALDFASYLITSPGTINGKAIPPRNVLQTSVVYDAWVPNEANEAFARAAGYGLAMPNVGTNAGIKTMALVRAPTTNPDPVPLPNVMPDSAMLIHDTPMPGVTAVLVQTSPSGHGDDQESSTSGHEYAIPFGQFNSGTPYPMVTKNFSVKTSYLQLQATTTRFLSDGFAGKVPNVTGFKPPIRDYDGDGYPDATDADPNDPTVH
jgi:hypothetical protein